VNKELVLLGVPKGFKLEELRMSADVEAVGTARFLEAMRDKLEWSRVVKHRSGWENPEECPMKFLHNLLKEHVEKGDMVDVGNIAMMIWNRQNPYGLTDKKRRMK
jgi:hypothetical protein